MRPPAGGGCNARAGETRGAIERFLKSSRRPILLEPGEEQFPLDDGCYQLDVSNGDLVIQVWDESRNLVRRVTAVHDERPGKLELVIEKFGKKPGRLILADLSRPAAATAERHGRRLTFREEFRRFLAREFPGWKTTELSTEPNLEHSLSPAYPRALLRRSQSGMAALACPRDASDATAALSFGLIWLDYLRRRERRLTIEGLVLFLPHGLERTTCLRLRWLDPALARYLVFVYSPEGFTARVDLADYGNLDTKLEPCRSTPAAADAALAPLVDRLRVAPGVECVECADGSASLRVRGLQFARVDGGKLLFGLERMKEAGTGSVGEIERLARELSRLRSAGAADRENPLYRRQPERWLESQVRAHIERVDASLHPAPVYGQVPAFAGGERGVIDLLAADIQGRLAVLELKASEDIHLPLQALDYWMRVRWHLERDEFRDNGYFPDVALSKSPPRLLLVAPSLDFHPTTETILRYFSPEVPVERIGLAVEWRKILRVAFRIEGAGCPL
jgi:hypothetical protein